jgi:hypothetical protein
LREDPFNRRIANGCGGYIVGSVALSAGRYQADMFNVYATPVADAEAWAEGGKRRQGECDEAERSR